LVNLFRKAATILDDRARTRTAASANEPRSDMSADTSFQQVHLTVRLIEEFDRQARLHGSTFMILNLPQRGQRAVSSYGSGEPIPPHVLKNDQLLTHLRRKQIRTLDLVPVFSALPESTHYFVRDGHMTRLGHQVVARSLHQYLLANALVPPP
jgi:hypothetical protein